MDITDTDVGPGIAEAPEKANTQVDTTDRPGPSAPPPPPPVSQLLTLSEKQRLCFWAAAQPLVNGARPSYIRIRRYFSAKYNGRLLEQGTINAALRASYTLIGFDLMAKPPKEPRRSQWPLLDSALFTWHYQCSNYESHKALKEQAMLLFPTLYPDQNLPKFSYTWGRRWRSGYIVFLHKNACRIAEAEYPGVGSPITRQQNTHTGTAAAAVQAAGVNDERDQSFEDNTPGGGRVFQPEQTLAEIETPAPEGANTRTT